MVQVITGILKFTFGFLSDKVRSYAVERLEDGGLTDQTLRNWIVRELDDIKSKLDGLSRKDLATSVSSLQQGFERLDMCFGQSIESVEPSASELPENEEQSQDTTNVGASTSTQTKAAQKAVTVENAVALANAIGKMRIKSNKTFELAKESFKKAEEKASEAFHNAALSTEERVLASEVRIASGILEHLERPEVVANDCLGYLQELHDMPGIQEIFSVQVKGGIKSLFKKDSRAAIVETVTKINLILADFISKFTKRRMAVFDWPMIKCGKRVVHPIYYKEESVQKMKKMGITVPWNIVKQKNIAAWSYAINSKGDIIGVRKGGGLRKFVKATGEVQPFCHSRSDDKTWGKSSIAINENDEVYVLSYRTFPLTNCEPKLSVYRPDGQCILHRSMDFIENRPLYIAVTKDEKILICNGLLLNQFVGVHVCDSNGRMIKSFGIRLPSAGKVVSNMICSGNKSPNEILLPTRRHEHDLQRVWTGLCVCTQEGQLKSTIKLPLPQSFSSFPARIISIIFDHVTKNYMVFIKDAGTRETCVECFSETGKQRNLLFLGDMAYMTGSYREFNLVNHANGVIAMVNQDSVLYLR